MGRTGYFSHKDCWKHEMGPGHPECPERLDAIEDQLGALVAGHKLATDRLEAAVLALARNMATLHALISEVASQPSDEF